MRALVLPNLSSEKAQMHTEQLIKKLQSLAIAVSMESHLKDSFPEFEIQFFNDFSQAVESCDLLIAVGGDGTIIHTAKHAAQAGKPILGVNIGRLGFVAELEPDEYDELDKLTTGDYLIENRMMLEIRTVLDGEEKVFTALNDAVISRAVTSRLPDFRLSLDGTEVCNYRGDGMILSTPTGCTAYSLSAGGPIIDPKMNCILFAPVCPHSLLTRPVVFSPDARLSVQAGIETREQLSLIMDGTTIVPISKQNHTVQFCRSRQTAKIIKLKKNNFYEIVNQKLGEGRSIR